LVRRRAVGGLTCVVLLSGLLAGCGSSSSGSVGAPSAVVPVTTPRQVPVDAPAKRHTAPTKVVLAQVNVVCNAVLHGLPPALTRPYNVDKLSRYGAAAAAPTRRVVVSLGRLEQLGDAVSLAALAAAWRQLQALYGSAQVVAQHRAAAASLGRQIVIRQQALKALADADKLPACTVAVGR
jgi:hypothetical protein